MLRSNKSKTATHRRQDSSAVWHGRLGALPSVNRAIRPAACQAAPRAARERASGPVRVARKAPLSEDRGRATEDEWPVSQSPR